MLIKVTNRCHAGCSHCLEGSTPAGEHTTADVFQRALDFTARIEGPAAGVVLLSGGECTEHPAILELVDAVLARGWLPVLLSNGQFLRDDALREAILSRDVQVQVTHDERFYPGKPPRFVDDHRVAYVKALSVMIPLGRFAGKQRADVPTRRAPASFNLRSATRGLGSFSAAVQLQRVRTLGGLSGACTPSVTAEGDVVAGESRLCFKLGTVDSTNDELTRAVLEMGSCNRCGLETGLGPRERTAIGLPPSQ